MIERGTADELAVLLRGAATSSRAGNRSVAIATLRSAVGLAPDDRTAHRRLAAAYAVAGDRDSACGEYDRFIARLEGRGFLDAATAERSYAAVLLASPAAAPLPLPFTRPSRRLTADQAFALRRVGVAIVAIVATIGAMVAAGAEIFTSRGTL